MKLTLKSIAHHRNGICGMPFHVVLFRYDGERRNMIATVFDGPDYRVAVLDVDMAAAGNVTFGENSWRGDRYANQLFAWVEGYYPAPEGV